MEFNKKLNPYYYEYLFYLMLDKVRKQQKLSVKTSHGRLLRENIDTYLKEKHNCSISDGTVNEALLCEAFDMTMWDSFKKDYDITYIDVAKTNESRRSARESGIKTDIIEMKPGIVDAVKAFTRNHFYAAIGNTKAITNNKINKLFTGNDYNLPISPYDPRWSNRETILNLGHTMGHILISDIDNNIGGDVDALLLEDDSGAGQVDAVKVNISKITNSDGDLQPVGSAATLLDVFGLTKLMSYIDPKDFASLSEWVMQPAKIKDGVFDKTKLMGVSALNRSLAILDELDEQGVDYVITKDRNPGQLKASIAGSGLDIRLTDVKDEEEFVGRCYQNGVIVRFTTDARLSEYKYDSYTPSPSESVDLLRLAQGKHVEGVGKGVWRKGAYTVPYKTVTDAKGNVSNVGIRFDTLNYSEPLRFIPDVDSAKEFLENAILSSRKNVEAMIALPYLIESFNNNQEAAIDGSYVPVFSGNSEISSIQQAYWDVIRGEKSALLLPGMDESVYREKVASLLSMDLDIKQYQVVHDMLAKGMTFVGDNGDRLSSLNAHLEYTLDVMIGTYDPELRLDVDGEVKELSFDPVRVSIFMDSARNQMSNIGDLVNTMTMTGVDVNTLMGDNFQSRIIRDRMIKFNETNVRNFDRATGLDGSFDSTQARILTVAWDTLTDRDYKVLSMQIDDNGVVRYEAIRDIYTRNNVDHQPVVGYLGQIFEPGELGTITTKFGSGDNYLFAPGYEAVILKQKIGENLSVEERTILRGYEQIMVDEIRGQIVTDTFSKRDVIGTTSGLNRVYRRLYDTRHSVDFLESAKEQGLSDEWVKAILETESRIVRYSNSIRDNSTINAEYNANKREIDIENDSMNDPWSLTDGRNMSIMTSEGDGFFDPMMTASGTNQGITRYLVESASVSPDGHIIRGDLGDRAPIAKLPEVENMKFNPFDRQQMTYSNLLRAESITEPVKTAMMTLGAWNADDPMIVSQRFADTHKIRSKSGELRSLKIGDKLSDFHGNKGVISMIIDPNMDKNDPKNKDLDKLIDIFSDNPDLDVVMSPFSAVSRFNGGTARDLMRNPDTLDLTSVGNGFIDGGMGSMSFIVTSMAVDSKTRIYEADDLAQGKGRKASSQLAWALGAQDAKAVLAEMYGYNARSIADLKEYLITMGLDISPTGDLRLGFDDLDASIEGEIRARYELPKLYDDGSDKRESINAMRKQFATLIGDKGGDLILPFPLDMPSGETLRKVGDNEWALPIISSHLRRSQSLSDGATVTHDFTTNYEKIFSNAVKYNYYKDLLDKNEGSAKDRDKWEKAMAVAKESSQMDYNRITNIIKTRKFDGKNNIIKNSIMSSRLPNSATSVWTSDPRLNIDEVAMSTKMAKSLGFNLKDDYALIWRDPILRDGGVRYMKVVINDDLVGVAINPAVDASFDGDFDGDSVAVVRLQSKAAQKEAREKLSLEANLLNFGSWREDDAEYDLFMQDSLDTKVAQYKDPELAIEFAELRKAANDVWFDFDNSERSEDDRRVFLEESRKIKDQLSEYYHRVWENEYGNAVLQFDNIEHHMQSVIESCVDTGAKGSLGKIESYARYIGAKPTSSLELGELRTFEDLGVPQVDRRDHLGVQTATAIKSFGTGVAGKFSQRGVRFMRNHALKPVLELTYPVTQSILQAKHDPEDALVKYEALMGPVRDLWRGRKLSRVESDSKVTWTPIRENGEYVMATKDEWISQFMDIYTDPQGLGVNVNADYVNEVAEHMSINGVMVGVEITNKGYDNQQENIVFADLLAAPMDVLAYDGNFDMYVEAAKQGVNLYEGKRNSYFQPHVIARNNMKLSMADLEPSGLDKDVIMENIGAADVRDGYISKRRYDSRFVSPVGSKVKMPTEMIVETLDDHKPSNISYDFEL